MEKLNSDELKELSNDIISDKAKLFEFYDQLRSRCMSNSDSDKADPDSLNLKDLIFLLPDFFILLCRLMADSEVSVARKCVISLIIGYIVLPFDIFPDIVPIIGQLDDFIFTIIGLDLIFADTDKKILQKNWPGKENVVDMIKMAIEKIEGSMHSPLMKIFKTFFSAQKKSV